MKIFNGNRLLPIWHDGNFLHAFHSKVLKKGAKVEQRFSGHAKEERENFYLSTGQS